MGDLSVSGLREVTSTLSTVAPGATFGDELLVTPPPHTETGATTAILVMVRSQTPDWLTALSIDRVAADDINTPLYLPHITRKERARGEMTSGLCGSKMSAGRAGKMAQSCQRRPSPLALFTTPFTSLRLRVYGYA